VFHRALKICLQEQVGENKVEGVERIPDPLRTNWEAGVLQQFETIFKQHEPEKVVCNQNVVRTISFEDAVKELLELSKKKIK